MKNVIICYKYESLLYLKSSSSVAKEFLKRLNLRNFRQSLIRTSKLSSQVKPGVSPKMELVYNTININTYCDNLLYTSIVLVKANFISITSCGRGKF